MDNITQSDIKACLNKSPEEIVDFFKAKGCRITWDWQDDWQECQAKSFTVAKVMEMDILQDIKNELVNALESGETLQTFKQNLESVLANEGWWKVKKTQTNPDTGETAEVELGSNRRMRQIFETNLTTSYRAGQYKQQWENRESRPWWMYVCKMLPTSREEHKALHGKVFRYDDPFWDSFYPPNGFNCRCDVIPLTKDEINKIKHYTLQPKLDKDGQQVVINGIPQYEHVLTKIETCKSTPTTLTQRNAQVTIDNRKMTYKQAFYQDGTMMNAVSTDRGWNYNPGKAMFGNTFNMQKKNGYSFLDKYDEPFRKAYETMQSEFSARLGIERAKIDKSKIKDIVFSNAIKEEVEHKIKDYVYQKEFTPSGKPYYVAEIREQAGAKNSSETKKLKKEKNAAVSLADEGFEVYLIAEDNPDGVSNYDAIVDGIRFDFKQVKEEIKAVSRDSRDGFSQAGNVFIRLEKNLSIFDVFNKVLGEFRDKGLEHGIVIIEYIQTKEKHYWLLEQKNIVDWL